MSNDTATSVATTHIQTVCEKLGVISDRLIEVRDGYATLLSQNLGEEAIGSREEKTPEPDIAVGGRVAEIFNQLNIIITIIDNLSSLNNRHREL